MNDYEWDRKLNIYTTGREYAHADEYHFHYEPTSYDVLIRLAESGYIDSSSVLVDYGCGKGRVGFFLNKMLGCRTIGIEYDERICQQAKQNQDTYAGPAGKNNSDIEFLCMCAEEFKIEDADCFYFFNPFSVNILKNVINKIINSYYENPRKIRLFFYYMEDDYLSYLLTAPELLFLEEIDCRDLFEGNNERERIMIFEVYT